MSLMLLISACDEGQPGYLIIQSSGGNQSSGSGGVSYNNDGTLTHSDTCGGAICGTLIHSNT